MINLGDKDDYKSKIGNVIDTAKFIFSNLKYLNERRNPLNHDVYI